MDVQKLEVTFGKFIFEIQTEDRLVRVGLKEKSETKKIYEKHAQIFNKDILDFLKNGILKTRDAKKLDLLARFYWAIAEGILALKTAESHDHIKTYFASSQVKVGNETLFYFELLPRIAKETIFVRREEYDAVKNKIVAKANPALLKLLMDEIGIIEQLGFGGYLDYFSQAKKLDYAKFYKICTKIKEETDKLWLENAPKVSQEILGRPFDRIKACHLIHLRSLSAFDNFYPVKRVVEVFEEFTRGLGLGDVLRRVKIDDASRPKKNPRAVCYWSNPPDEVHLVIKPIGGEQDYEAMFHEGGHALHGVAIDPKIPFVHRNLAISNALTEAYAFIFEDLIFEPAFLSTYLNVSAFSAQKIKWQAYFVNLMMLRRYLGKFMYEYEMFLPAGKAGSKKAINQGPGLYAKRLGETTGFVTDKVNWLSDMDSGFYSADYLRAWIGASQLKDYLVERFGERWFINKKAGEFLRKLYSRGVANELEQVVEELGYRAWDIGYLIREYGVLRS